jgi:predicted XRE-type DNA-binding protein
VGKLIINKKIKANLKQQQIKQKKIINLMTIIKN